MGEIWKLMNTENGQAEVGLRRSYGGAMQYNIVDHQLYGITYGLVNPYLEAGGDKHTNNIETKM